jgi:regulator of sigma E protease
VLAGPVANLVLAITLYAGLFLHGVDEPVAVLASPFADSLATDAGLRGQEHVSRVALGDGAWTEVVSYGDFQWNLTQAALSQRNLHIEYMRPLEAVPSISVIRLADLDASVVDAQMFHRIGLAGPWSLARIEALVPGGAAEMSGLRVGDVVMQVDGTVIADARHLRELIGLSGANSSPSAQRWLVQRGEVPFELTLTPSVVVENSLSKGRIGAFIGAPVEMTNVRFGFLKSLSGAMYKTWEVSEMTLHMLAQILTGNASVKNLSGPLSIADYAGKSASLGMPAFVTFLALISVSLAVFNLLPVPMLDGGHLLYYLWEWVAGRPVSESLMVKMQQVGMCLLFSLLSIALFNDVLRLNQ